MHFIWSHKGLRCQRGPFDFSRTPAPWCAAAAPSATSGCHGKAYHRVLTAHGADKTDTAGRQTVKRPIQRRLKTVRLFKGAAPTHFQRPGHFFIVERVQENFLLFVCFSPLFYYMLTVKLVDFYVFLRFDKKMCVCVCVLVLFMLKE